MLYLDFGNDAQSAMLYVAKADEHGGTLKNLLQNFPETRAALPIDADQLEKSLTEIPIGPFSFGEEGIGVGIREKKGVGVLEIPDTPRQAKKQAAKSNLDAAPRRRFPAKLSDRDAVEIVYEERLEEIAAFLKAGLSVLVQCDKAIVAHVYPRAVELSARAAVLDTEASPKTQEEDPLAAMAAGSAGLIGRLGEILVDLKDTQTLVLAYLDLLCAGPENSLSQESRRLAEHLFRHPKASLLAFVDPTLSLPPILASRFPIHLELSGIPRECKIGNGFVAPTLSLITLAAELELCPQFDPVGLFKHVSGFNPVQYRDAMRFVEATAQGRVSEDELISALQIFKKGSGQDVQLPDKSFDDIGGYRDLVARLRQIAKLMAGGAFDIPEKLRRQLLPRGLMLHGRPGTGKTLLAKALAKEMNATLQIVSGPEVMDMYVGESERKIRNLFATARRNAPSVIIFDEFDAIATQRTDQGDGGARAGNAVVAQLLTELDGFHEDLDVLVVATTNRIDIIDEALLRPSRFLPIEVDLPDDDARLSIARLHAKGYGLEELMPEDALRLIAQYSEGLNGDEIRAVFQEAATAHFLQGGEIDLALLGSFVGRMRERREQRERRHLGARARTAARNRDEDAATPLLANPDTDDPEENRDETHA